MAHSFLAFIDESGDEGLARFREQGARGGASKWLVISACVYRAHHVQSAVKWRDAICARMPERKSREIHFRDLNHGQKLTTCRVLATQPVRALSVICEKTHIPAGIYTQPNQLYFYQTRYLLERLSWLCRDHSPGANGQVKITFSRRRNRDVDDFKDYMTTLRNDPDVRIHWPCVPIDDIEAKDHGSLASLQLVDVVASAFAHGVEPDRYGNCEPRYAELLRRVTYHRRKNFFSYGVKMFPPAGELALSEDQQRFIALFS